MTCRGRWKTRISLVAVVAIVTSIFAIPAMADEDEGQPFVRITYMCQVVPGDENGTHVELFTGDGTELVEAEAGQHMWRIGDARDGDLWTGGLESATYSTNFLDMTGTASPGSVDFHATDDSANGVQVFTDPGPNLSGGSASVSGDECELISLDEPAPESRSDCMRGGFEDFGFRNQGLCIASVQSNENSNHHR